MSFLAEVLKLLPHLTDEEAAEVTTRLKARLSLASAKPVEEEDWLFYGIVRELRRRGLMKRQLGPVEACRIAPKYAVESAEVRAVLTGGKRLSRPQLTVLGSLSAEALANFLCVPLGPKVMLVNVGRTIEAFENAYPGYREAGLLGALLPKERGG
jgi:hypothetical protein